MILRLVFPALLLLVCAGCGSDKSGPGHSTIVTLTEGQAAGVPSPYDDQITVYRGLPYAKPPVGDLRWQAPAPAESWRGVRYADTFSESCYQPRHWDYFVWRRDDFAVSEDCLYLNVWSPVAADNLPVMVWFHGGSHISGQGHSLIFDGTTLAKQDVLVVTVNYRLGPFGFLAHPWLSETGDTGTSGNYGLMDSIAALQWVQRNADALGGDSGNVTIFGQSAGAQSVCSLMASGRARGLFHKVIGQSASCLSSVATTDVNGYHRGSELVSKLGVKSAEELLAAEADALLEAMVASNWQSETRITIDGYVLDEQPPEVFSSGAQARVPVMLGFLADEDEQFFPVTEAVTEAQLDEFLTFVAGQRAAELKAQYDMADLTPGELKGVISTDIYIALGMQRWAEYQDAIGQPTYLYYMDHIPPAFHIYMPEQPFLDLPGGPRSGGAYHSGDLALVFGSTDKVGYDWTDDDRAVSEHMVRYWTNFAKTGNPNDPGVTEWGAFTRDSLNTQVINVSPATVSGVKTRILDILSHRQPL